MISMLRPLGRLVLLVSALAASPALAQSSGFDTYTAAAEQFDRLAAQAAARATPPRITDPDVAPVLHVLGDWRGLFGGRHFVAADGPQLLALAMRSAGVPSYYLQFGVTGSSDAASNAQVNRNGIAYQDELIPLVAFSVDCFSAYVEANLDALQQVQGPPTPEQRLTLISIRLHYGNMLTEFLGALGDPQMRPQNRAILAEGFARNRAIVARGLSLTQRSSLTLQASRIQALVGPAGRQQLRLFIEVLRSAPCDGLCAI